MSRRIFISYQHEDQMQGKGFNLLRYNKHLDVNFVGRHLLDPVKSTNADYITRRIKEELATTSVTVVLIGKQTAGSEWVDHEITWSTEKRPPNGLVGIRLDPSAEVPEQLRERGAEILDWFEPGDVDEFGPAIERAAQAARGALSMVSASGTSCSR